jgi:hypothetical protein
MPSLAVHILVRASLRPGRTFEPTGPGISGSGLHDALKVALFLCFFHLPATELRLNGVLGCPPPASKCPDYAKIVHLGNAPST